MIIHNIYVISQKSAFISIPSAKNQQFSSIPSAKNQQFISINKNGYNVIDIRILIIKN